MNKLLSEETRSLLAILSIGFVVFGFFFAMIFVAPPAIVCAFLAFHNSPGGKVIEPMYKIFAFLGLALGILEFSLEILLLTGLVTPII